MQGSDTYLQNSFLTIQITRPLHRTWRLSRQNTPKNRTASVWFLGVFFPLVLRIFYWEVLRNPLEFRSPWEGFSTRKSLSFFFSAFPKTAKTLEFSPSPRFPYLPPNSTEFGNPGHTRKPGRFMAAFWIQNGVFSGKLGCFSLIFFACSPHLFSPFSRARC